MREGDLLFTIDPRPHEAALEQADANLQESQLRLNMLERTLSVMFT